MSNKGKFILERKIFESDIWEKPPYFLKIWIWIIGKANYKKVRKGGKVYNRGEFLTSYEEVINANEWREHWRTQRLNKGQIFRVYKFLKRTKRIIAKKATRGFWVKVLNYNEIQELTKNKDEQQSNSSVTVARQGKRKKDKKEKNIEESIDSSDELSKKSKGVEKEEVSRIINTFIDYVKSIKGFTPVVNRATDGKLIKIRLNEFTEDDLIDAINWYLNSDLADKWGVNLKTALCASSMNKWLAQREY